MAATNRLFFTASEYEQSEAARAVSPAYGALYWALVNRVERRAAAPGLGDPGVASQWWHYCSEYLTDAALVHRLHPSANIAAWLRDAALSVARRPLADWVGPVFRDHAAKPLLGHLETAHLAWALAIVLDLAPDLFPEAERAELATALREKGLRLCQSWLDRERHVSNWRCILTGGLAMAAAVLGDAPAMERAAREYALCSGFFQPDGSFGESLQYGNYALYGLTMAREALARRCPALERTLPFLPHGKKPVWDAYSLFYKKPLTGPNPYPQARSANFHDSAALYRPSADVLMHLAARAQTQLPKEAGLARWLFDTLYLPVIETGGHDRASFGFVNDFGFLTLLLWPQAAAPLSPEEADLPLTAAFSAGDAFARDAWNGRTVLATRTGSDPLRSAAHHHGDLNSFILVHNRERLLADPGHSCYRNLIHEMECSTQTHNTLTFQTAAGTTIQQRRDASRRLTEEGIEPPVDRGAHRLLTAREGEVSVIGSEAATLYGEPLIEFSRFWILAGPHVLFIVDHILSYEPLQPSAHWLLNDRDGLLDLKFFPDRLVARRGEAAMKLFNLSGARLSGPLYSYVHDAYHPLPAQSGEGRPGSGLLITWTQPRAATEATLVHAIALDDPGSIPGWHLKTEPPYAVVLEAPRAAATWKLQTGPGEITVEESVTGHSYAIHKESGAWRLIPAHL